MVCLIGTFNQSVFIKGIKTAKAIIRKITILLIVPNFDNIFDKKNGALQFVSFFSVYTNQNNLKVAESISTVVVR